MREVAAAEAAVLKAVRECPDGCRPAELIGQVEGRTGFRHGVISEAIWRLVAEMKIDLSPDWKVTGTDPRSAL